MAEQHKAAILQELIQHFAPRRVPAWAVQSVSWVDACLARVESNLKSCPHGQRFLQHNPHWKELSGLEEFWKRAVQQYDGCTPRNQPLPHVLASEVADLLFANLRVSASNEQRYNNFLYRGPPPGVHQLPEYSAKQGIRELTIPPNLHMRDSAGHSQRIRAQLDALPRRKQSTRSSIFL